MKHYILPLILIASLLSCKKEKKVAPSPAPPVKIAVAPRKTDTIPDSASFKLMIKKDSASIDETMLIFNHNAPGNFAFNLDARYFPGNGLASLASISGDSVACAIQVLPYRSIRAICLEVHAKHTGIYSLGISYFHKIPASIHVWLQDRARKDSLDLRVGNYAFYVDKADSSTYGRHRFSIFLR